MYLSTKILSTAHLCMFVESCPSYIYAISTGHNANHYQTQLISIICNGKNMENFRGS